MAINYYASRKVRSIEEEEQPLQQQAAGGGFNKAQTGQSGNLCCILLFRESYPRPPVNWNWRLDQYRMRNANTMPQSDNKWDNTALHSNDDDDACYCQFLKKMRL